MLSGNVTSEVNKTHKEKQRNRKLIRKMAGIPQKNVGERSDVPIREKFFLDKSTQRTNLSFHNRIYRRRRL